MVVGQDQKQLGALVVPSLEGFREAGLHAESVEELSGSDDAEKRVLDEIKGLITSDSGFKSFEYIQSVRLVPKEFEIGDEMTNTFKIKRHVVTDKHADLIDAVFEK